MGDKSIRKEIKKKKAKKAPVNSTPIASIVKKPEENTIKKGSV